MFVKEFLGGVRVLQPSAENLRDPPLWMFLTPSLSFNSVVYLRHTLRTNGSEMSLMFIYVAFEINNQWYVCAVPRTAQAIAQLVKFIFF